MVLHCEAERSLEAVKCKESQGPRFDWEGVCVLKYILEYHFENKIFWLCPRACGVLVPQPGIEPTPLHWQQEALITEPPGKSPGASLLLKRGLIFLSLTSGHRRGYINVQFSNHFCMVPPTISLESLPSSFYIQCLKSDSIT